MLKKRDTRKGTTLFTGAAAVLACSIIAAGCGKSDPAASSSAAGDVKLDSLPSTASMTKANSGSSAFVSSSSLLSGSRISTHAVSGSAPKMTELKAGADQYFWDGLVATINDSSFNSLSTSQKQAIRDKFWGGVSGGPGGQGACQMASSVGEAFGRMLQAGTSQCYMRNMAKASSGVTITGADKNTLFEQGGSNKRVHVAVSGGGGDGPGGDMDIYVKVYGTDTVGSDVYKTSLLFCSNSTKTGLEVIEINKSSGKATFSNQNDESGHTGVSTVVAYLKKTDGTYEWDASKDRTAFAHYTGDWGAFKSDLTITSSNQIINKMMNSSSWGSSKVYSIAGFTGSDLKSLRFLEAGFKNYWSDGGSNSNSFSGGTEWQDTYYAATPSSALATQAGAVEFASDSFYSSITAPTVDMSLDDCGGSTDATVTMDFNDAGTQAVAAICEADRFSDYDMCFNTSVQTAQSKLFGF